jgi:nicotinamide-nucleotide amidase
VDSGKFGSVFIEGLRNWRIFFNTRGLTQCSEISFHYGETEKIGNETKGDMKVEIVAIGTELLLGQIVDTNSAFIAQQMTTIGLDLHFKATVGDNLERIKSTLHTALNRSDFIITTGGIGPTLDDLTREAVAEVTGRTLVFQPHLYNQIQDFFTRLGRPVGLNNRRQAFIPEGSIPIENPVGTAPGFIVEQNGKALISVPGVPHEMRYFIDHSVLPYLKKKLGIHEVIVSRVLKFFGIGESVVDERLADLIEAGRNPTIGLLAHTQIGEIHVRLTAKADDQTKAKTLISPLEAEICSRLPGYFFGADEETYEGVLSLLLRQAGLSLAIVESFFGTSVVQVLKGVEGSSKFLRLGLTLTSAGMITKILNLPQKSGTDPALYGRETTQALAEGVRRLAGADIGLGITGKAGREKEEDHQIYIALAHAEGTDSVEERWPFSMRYIENRATKMAMAKLRSYILKRFQEGQGFKG